MLCGSLKLQHRLERDCDRAFLILCFFLTNANVGMKFAPNLAVCSVSPSLDIGRIIYFHISYGLPLSNHAFKMF